MGCFYTQSVVTDIFPYNLSYLLGFIRFTSITSTNILDPLYNFTELAWSLILSITSMSTIVADVFWNMWFRLCF